MSAVLFLHLMCAAAWLGCILVEAVCEHSIEPTPPMRLFISRMHWTTDKAIEVPALAGVLVTGGLMLGRVQPGPLLWAKIGLGLMAIVANLICVGLVVKRLRLARAGDFAGWEQVDHWQHKIGAVVLLAMVGALAIGGALLIRQ